MQKRFTKNAEKALEYAKKTARSLGHNYIGTEHILLGLLKTKGVAADILQENGVNPDVIKALIEDFMSSGKQVMVADDARYTPRAEGVINRSTSEAERLGSSSVGTEHLLIAILKENKVEYEFRTTIIKEFHTLHDIENICMMIGTSSKYYLQNFVDSDDVPRKNLHGFTREELQSMNTVLQRRFPNMEIRSL